MNPQHNLDCGHIERSSLDSSDQKSAAELRIFAIFPHQSCGLVTTLLTYLND